MPKTRFNESKSNESRLMTSKGKRKIMLKNEEKLLEGIISRQIDEKEAIKMYNSIVNDADELNRLELTKPRKKCFQYLSSCKEFLWDLKQMRK